jgi:hypothetical protein
VRQNEGAESLVQGTVDLLSGMRSSMRETAALMGCGDEGD